MCSRLATSLADRPSAESCKTSRWRGVNRRAAGQGDEGVVQVRLLEFEARDIEATRETVRGLPVVKAEVGPADAPTVVLEGHIDVVPAHAEQFDDERDDRAHQ